MGKSRSQVCGEIPIRPVLGHNKTTPVPRSSEDGDSYVHSERLRGAFPTPKQVLNYSVFSRPTSTSPLTSAARQSPS